MVVEGSRYMQLVEFIICIHLNPKPNRRRFQKSFHISFKIQRETERWRVHVAKMGYRVVGTHRRVTQAEMETISHFRGGEQQRRWLNLEQAEARWSLASDLAALRLEI